MHNPFSFFTISIDSNGIISGYNLDDSGSESKELEIPEGKSISEFLGDDISLYLNKAAKGNTVYFNGSAPFINGKKTLLSFFLTQDNNGFRLIAFRSFKASEDILTELAGGIAHSFNNGLNEIVGNAELLRIVKPDCNEVDEFTGNIIASVKKMTKLMNKVLEYARGGVFEKISIVFDQYLSVLIAEMEIPSNIIFSSDLNCSKSILFETGKLKTVLDSLIKNSLDSLEERDEGRINVSTYSAKRSGKNYACLSVEDNGCGMEKDVMEKMFNPFFSTKRSGRGLDLASVQGIVENIGGFIEVDSGVNVGTAVHIFVPVEEKIEEVVLKDEKGTGIGKILVVEDEELVLDTTTLILEKNGYEVIGVTTGEDAVKILEESSDIDLVLLDINLPGISGFDVLEEVFHEVQTKFIICSAWCDRKTVEKYKGKGIPFLAKPYSFDVLLNIIRKNIDRRRHKRFSLNNETFVSLGDSKENRGKIVDISLGGICFCYSGMVVRIGEQCRINLGCSDDFIKSIPFILIQDKEDNKVARGRFGELNSDQRQALNAFITRNSTPE